LEANIEFSAFDCVEKLLISIELQNLKHRIWFQSLREVANSEILQVYIACNQGLEGFIFFETLKSKVPVA
jgi:hypothetical protein